MKGFLNFIRWTLSLILSLLLSIILSLTPLLVATSIIITDRENPKQWIADSGIYENASEILVDALPTPEDPVDGEDYPNPLDLDIPEVTNSLITSEFAQESIEASIDGAYDFLEGKTDKLTISLKLDTFQEKYEQFVGEMASAQFGTDINDLGSLPACTPQQVAQLDAGDYSSLSEPCIPPNIDLDSLFSSTLDAFKAQDSVLPGEAVGDQFKFSPEMEIDPDSVERIQYIYGIVQQLPVYTLGSLLILVPLIILIAPSFKKGLNIVGSTALLVGLVSTGLFLIYKVTGTKMLDLIQLALDNTGQIPIPSTYITSILSAIITALIQQAIIYSSIILGGAILLLGIAALINRTKKDSQEPTKEEEEEVVEEKEYITKEKAARSKTTTSLPSTDEESPGKSPS